MKVLCSPMNMDYEATVENVVSVNLDQCLIATQTDRELNDPYCVDFNWWRCENCEIIRDSARYE